MTTAEERRKQRLETIAQGRREAHDRLHVDTKVIHGFLSDEDRITIINWAHQIKDQVPLKSRLKSDDAPGNRRSDFCASLPNAPMAVIHGIMERAAEALGVDTYAPSPYRPRLVIHDVNADTRSHVDPHGGMNAAHHRARFGEDSEWQCDHHYKGNVLVQAADVGGVFTLTDMPQEMQAGSLIGFWGGIPHSVTKVEAGERILITFGWCKNDS